MNTIVMGISLTKQISQIKVLFELFFTFLYSFHDSAKFSMFDAAHIEGYPIKTFVLFDKIYKNFCTFVHL